MYQQREPVTEPPGAANPPDEELLREYATTSAESAFARLVERHVHVVYSAAFRQTGNHAMAQDVSQAVFTILARKAGSLRREAVLVGWLFRAVRYAALDARKIDARRQAREQEAAQMQVTDSSSETETQWEEFAPILDEALADLGATDRHAILLRFFERKSFGEIGTTLGGNENSARLRVVRAVEKLRAGTDPENPANFLRTETIDWEPGSGLSLSFTAMSNKTYSVEACSFATSAPWTPIADVLAASTNRSVRINDPPKENQRQRFYRLTTPRAQ